MDYAYISSQKQLIDFCGVMAASKTIAVDTEFVAEDTYRPDLCLVQVAAGDRLALIDPRLLGDVTPFWEQLAAPGHTTIVHAGREEFQFCLRASHRRPHDLVDVQLAAALVGLEYPAAYRSLVLKLLGTSLPKGETRTDWRRRPLSARQLEYALQDVLYLQPMCDELVERLDRLDRRAWLAEEMTAWQEQLVHIQSHEQWRRVSGITGLSPRALGIVRELWRWREEEAERRNRPVRRVLRDDLIVELARRQTSDPRRIGTVRGLERRDLRQHLAEFSARIERALALDDRDLPQANPRPAPPQLNLLSQFLNTALNSICREAQVAPSLVGTAQDVRELIAWRLNLHDAATDGPPLLARSWRAAVVGQRIEQLLQGRLALRVADPLAENPLAFEPSDDQ